MIIFLYGDDAYRSNQKLKALKSKYVEKYGHTNLETFEDGFELGKIKEAVTALPFLADKRLIIIKNLFKSKNPTMPSGLRGASKNILDGVVQILDHVPEETIAVFYEDSVPDKRTVLFKKLIKEKSEEFEKLQGFRLIKWIENEVEGRGGKISGKDADKLVSYVGDDLADLETEIQKLISYKNGAPITGDDISKLVNSRLTATIFDLTDALGNKDFKKAEKAISELVAGGENEIYILVMIASHIKNLLIVSDFKGNPDKGAVAKEAGLHPFVAQKAVSQLRNFDTGGLKRIYQKIQETDMMIKEGEREPRLALDILIKEVCDG